MNVDDSNGVLGDTIGWVDDTNGEVSDTSGGVNYTLCTAGDNVGERG